MSAAVPDPIGKALPPASVSVIIAHLNQPDALRSLLEGLTRGTRLPAEVLVIDNGSTAPPDAICAAFPFVRLLCEPTPGPGPARNLGARMARGDVLAFTDADCRVGSGWIDVIGQAFQDPAVTIVGGDVRTVSATPSRPTMAEAYDALFAFRARHYIRSRGFALTCNLAVRAEVFRSVGGFAGLDLAEDVDWGQRATQLGHRIRFNPDMVVDHPARRSIGDLKAKWTRQTAHAFAAIAPERRGRIGWALRALAMFPSPLAALPRIVLSRRISGFRARILAFACLCLIRIHRGRVMLWLLAGGDPSALLARWNRPQGQG